MGSKFRCLFTASVTVTEKSGLKKKNKTKKTHEKMAANLPELYKNNVRPVGD